MKNSILFILAMACILFSCQKEKLPNYGGDGSHQNNQGNTTTLKISKKKLTTSSDSFKDSISIQTDTSWQILNIPTWLTVNPTSGNGNAKIFLEAEENTGDTERKDTVQVAAGSDTLKVVITQLVSHALSVSKDKIDSTAASFKDSLQVITKIKWEVIELPTWISVDPSNGEGETKIHLDVEKNTHTQERKGTFKIATDFDTVSIRVQQDAAIEDAVSATSFDFDFDESTSKSLHITTAGSWSFSNVPSWVHLDNDDGSGESDVEISVDESFLGTSRNKDIDLDINGTKTKISISQDVNPKLDISNDITLDRQGKYLDLNNANYIDRLIFTGQNAAAFNFNAGTSFSIALKVKIGDNGTTQPRIFNRDNGTSTLALVELRDGSTPNGKLAWVLKDENDEYVREGPTGGSSGPDAQAETTPINDGEWHHIVMVYDFGNQESYMYVDGEKQAEIALDFPGSFDMGTETMFIGDFSDAAKGSNWNFGGAIDELRVWKKAITQTEVYADAANITLPGSSPAINFEFETTTNNKISDEAGNIEGELKNSAELSQ